MGIRAPIIREGDDLVDIVVRSVVDAAQNEGFELGDRDVVAVTEAVVGRAQGNYATLDQIAGDVRAKTGGGTVGVVFPILSRNRFSKMLEGIAKGCDKVLLQLSYPSDEVGNHLISLDVLDEKGVNPYTDSFDEKQFREIFGYDTVHEFTGVDYIEYYKGLSDNIEILFSNQVKNIVKYTDTVIACDVHSRARTKRLLKAAGVKTVLGMDDILNAPFEGSGYNKDYGMLGYNRTSETQVKLFPRDCEIFVEGIKRGLYERTGKNVEVMVYGDGAFKDPKCGIWEFDDPVVSPAYTPGLTGKTNEIKIKYLADNKFGDLKGAELEEALKDSIRNKGANLVGKDEALGTTPRYITDLLGSLCDLVSGSGDKGTPIVLIQGYFDNYAM